MPSVSVVIPLYNAEKYIAEAVTSVLSQTYQDFELIVVDDGCLDESVSVLRQFRDSRIRLIRQENRGLAGARNTGIRHARGRYIALLDADDRFHPDKLIKHVEHLDGNPKLGISFSQSAFIDEAGNYLGIVQTPKLTGITAKDIFCRNPIGNGSTPMMRKAVFNDICFRHAQRQFEQDCYFDESLRQSEDIECWLRIANTTSWRFEGLGLPLTDYRINNQGLSANMEKQYQSWLLVRDKIKSIAPKFIERHARLAEAYQLRYLARRAICSRDGTQAFALIFKALSCDWRISFYEPMRTLNTLVCSALLKVLSLEVYEALEQHAMHMISLLRRAKAVDSLGVR